MFHSTRCCERCGGPIIGRRVDAKYCGSSCLWKVSGKRYRESLPEEKRKAKIVRDFAADKANPSRVKARQARHRANNLEARREATRKWRAANPDQNRVWRAANPDKRSNYRHTRRAREWNNPLGSVGVSHRDWVRLLWRYNGCCAYCGKKSNKLQKDHVVPLCRGGRHSAGNILPACPRCNQSKGGLLLVEWQHRLRSAKNARACNASFVRASA